ncbi:MULTISPECIES: DUF4255 domain-containing protein [Methylomonas]|uniref:Pvc16 N-terminal domain-containing protein n=2 Tax=Methylomonas TaxID=416 RepID=A0A126T2E0_9GAMM|nr:MULTISPECIES: DUF4255 domain-containing protein [Methylomonas]AMK76251.1 hypothetical protein JT25_007055 [Methylomonas denitrificans]OAI00692.1 hypothetical protein A1342_17460 [Methylomonas methanica]TCV88270.1 uncharacterized protein DUF4255 [Methylomonas methanica]
MASYRGVTGALLALESFLTSRLPAELSSEPTNAQAKLLGSADIANILTGNLLGIYLHRITIDPHGRQRSFAQRGSDQSAPQAELPVNLHFLLIANAASATIEADLLSWAMVELANQCQLDISHIQDIDDEWGQAEVLNIAPDEMTTEDLMRIWDVFKSPYTSTVPYVARTVRLRLQRPRTEGPPVSTRIFPGGTI